MFGWFKKAKTIATQELPPVAQAIVDLIKSEPDQWTSDRHYFKHSAGMRIWISNGAWAIHVEITSDNGYSKKQILAQAEACEPTRSHKAIWDAYEWWQTNGNVVTVHKYIQKANELKFARNVQFLNELVDKDIREIETRHGMRPPKPQTGQKTKTFLERKQVLQNLGVNTTGLSLTQIDELYEEEFIGEESQKYYISRQASLSTEYSCEM